MFRTPQAIVDAPAAAAPAPQRLQPLLEALQRYFDLMHDCDTSRYDSVFLPTANLHGYRDGALMAWSGETYRAILDKRVSPKSLGAAREDEILLVEFASDDLAFVKVRLRITTMVFVDYLTWHRVDEGWRIGAKGFHLEPTAP